MYQSRPVDILFPVAAAKKRQGICPSCNVVIADGGFRDALSFKEYNISGLCQECQDRVFGV